MGRFIYLDNAATTPLHTRALDAMMPYLTSDYGNPSATYALAKTAGDAVQRARRTVASILACKPTEVIFTSGGTESINTAIKGVAFQQKKARAGNHIVTSVIEHHAVLHACQYLERFGFEVTYVPVDRHGLVDPAGVASAVTERTALVSIMTANNEVGTIQPVIEIAAAVRERAQALKKRIPFHTDAVQAPNSLRLNFADHGIDLLSLAAHKFRGPKGMGVLFVRRGVPFLAQQNGGGQERQRRAGTENVAGIVATAEALRITQEGLEADSARIRSLAARLRDGILSSIPDARINGHPERRLANNVSVSFDGADARDLLAGLDAAGVACSAGAACGATTLEPSHVLIAMGVPIERAISTLRFSLGHETAAADIDYVLEHLPEIVEQSRGTRLAAARLDADARPSPCYDPRMSERYWEFVVHDARGRRRRGTVTWCDALPSPLAPPSPPAEFAIVVLTSKSHIASAPDATAICIPGVPKIRPITDPAPQHLPARVESLTLPPHRMARYAAGRIVMPVSGLIEPADVFPPHNDHPRLDRLALALLEVADADALAPYTALIRHEFGLSRGADPLEALGTRLVPADPESRPPARAPGVLRLAKALRRMREGNAPETAFEQFTEDVRFLKLFDDGDQAWPRDALGRLLDDVLDPPRPTPRHGADAAGGTPMRPPRHRTSCPSAAGRAMYRRRRMRERHHQAAVRGRRQRARVRHPPRLRARQSRRGVRRQPPQRRHVGGKQAGEEARHGVQPEDRHLRTRRGRDRRPPHRHRQDPHVQQRQRHRRARAHPQAAAR